MTATISICAHSCIHYQQRNNQDKHHLHTNSLLNFIASCPFYTESSGSHTLLILIGKSKNKSKLSMISRSEQKKHTQKANVG